MLPKLKAGGGVAKGGGRGEERGEASGDAMRQTSMRREEGSEQQQEVAVKSPGGMSARKPKQGRRSSKQDASDSMDFATIRDRREGTTTSKRLLVKTMGYHDMQAFMQRAERDVEETRMALESSKRSISEAETAFQQSVRSSAMWFVEKMQHKMKDRLDNKHKWVAVRAASFVLSLFFEIKSRALQDDKSEQGDLGDQSSSQVEPTDIVQDLLLSVQEDKSIDEFLLMLAKARAAAETEWMVLKEKIRRGPFLDSLNNLWHAIDEFEFGYPHRIQIYQSQKKELKVLVVRYKDELRESVEYANRTLRMIFHTVRMHGIAVSGGLSLPSPESLFQSDLLIFDEKRGGKRNNNANIEIQNFKKYFNRVLNRLHELVIDADHEMSYRTRAYLSKALENIKQENQTLIEQINQCKENTRSTFEKQAAALEPYENSHKERVAEGLHERDKHKQQLAEALASKEEGLAAKKLRLSELKEQLAAKKTELQATKERSKLAAKELDSLMNAARQRDETLVLCLSIVTCEDSLESIKTYLPSKVNIKNEISNSVEMLANEIISREMELKQALKLIHEQKTSCLRIFADFENQPPDTIQREIERQKQNKIDMEEIQKIINVYMHQTDFYNLDSSKLNAFVHLHLPFASPEVWRDFLIARYDEIFNDMQEKELNVSPEDDLKALIASLSDYGYSPEETAGKPYEELKKLLEEEQGVSRMN
eukprot:39437-Hanusia_phi.AAC.4